MVVPARGAPLPSETPVAFRDEVLHRFASGCSAARVLGWCLPPDGYRTFAASWVYFRWADDVVDAPDRSPADVRRFVAGQAALLAGARGPETTEELAFVASIADPVRGPALLRASERMWEALRWDAGRSGRATAAELEAQVARIGDAYAIALWACADGPGSPSPAACALARQATAAHQLRDLALDLTLGYDNVPQGEERGPAWIVARAAQVDAAFARWLPGLRGLPPRVRWVFQLLAWRYRLVAWRAARGAR